jgi:hypothetical protein
VPEKPRRTHVHGRPTEVRTLVTGLLGGGGTLVALPNAYRWVAAIPAFVGASASAWTYVVTHGGLSGLWHSLVHGEGSA